jgi:hypothetical protein
LRSRWLVLALVLVNLSVTVPLAASLNIWEDEAFSLNTSGAGVGYAVRQALHFELQPPLYFVLLTVWRHVNSSIFFARFFSVVCAGLTIYVITTISKQIFPEVHPAWLAAAVALNPFLIYAAVEIRVYAMVILLCALLLLVFFKSYLTPGLQPPSRTWYGILAVSALYTQYYLGFLLVANAVVLLILKRWSLLRIYLVQMIAVAACSAPLLLIIPDQVSSEFAVSKGEVSCFGSVTEVSKRAVRYVFPSDWASLNRASLLHVGILLGSLGMAIRFRHFITSSDIAMWTVTVTLFLCFVALINLTARIFLEERHMAALFLPAIICAFSLVKGRGGRKILLTWTILVVFLCGSSLLIKYRLMAKPGDFKRVASYIMASEGPGQAVLAFNATAGLVLAHYYSGPNQLLSLPKECDLRSSRMDGYEIKDEEQIRKRLLEVPGDPHYLWLVTNGDCGRFNSDLNCRTLEDFISKYFYVERNQSFFLSRVRLLRRKDGISLTSFKTPAILERMLLPNGSSNGHDGRS